jgi:ankyrin repeat protein
MIRRARGDGEPVDILLKRHAKPNVQSHRGVTALMMGSPAGCTDAVRARLAGKAHPNTPDVTGRTAVAPARPSGRGAIEAMLRKAGGRG